MKNRTRGFTLLEVITVFVIFAIISSLIIAGVSAHKRAALIAKTRVQFVQYETAINMYCREYGDLPPFFCDEELISLADGDNSSTFVKILSGRDTSGNKLSENDREKLNPKEKEFHDFTDDEFFIKSDGTHDYASLADAFNNRNIFVIVEDPFDDDTIISKRKFPEVVQKYIRGSGVKSAVVIFSILDDNRTIISNCLDQYL
ncbi:MAG: type II secretion system GspH family protein [Puniceicoccales bacterium]|jgi:prepilin-type N-terminal cleavage/methylation domain-containing protein|nr:type II secretion system GspH family protein [Puniceicoccales bacterium]